MLIPVRCFTCGFILGDKWILYNKLVAGIKGSSEMKDEYMDPGKPIAKSPEGKVMDDLKIKRYCCRRHMLGNVDIIDDL